MSRRPPSISPSWLSTPGLRILKDQLIEDRLWWMRWQADMMMMMVFGLVLMTTMMMIMDMMEMIKVVFRSFCCNMISVCWISLSDFRLLIISDFRLVSGGASSPWHGQACAFIHTRYIYFWSRDIHTEIYTNYCKESTSIRNWIIWSLLMTKLTDNPHLWIVIDQSSSDTLFTSSLHYHLPLLVSSSSQ